MSYGRKPYDNTDNCGCTNNHNSNMSPKCQPYKSHHEHCEKHHHRPIEKPSCPPPCDPPFPPVIPPFVPMPTYPIPTCPPVPHSPWDNPCQNHCNHDYARPCPPPFPPFVPFVQPTEPTGPTTSESFLAASLTPASGTTSALTATPTGLNLTPLSASGIITNGSTITFTNAGTYVVTLTLPVTTSVGTATLTFTPTLTSGSTINPCTFSATLSSGLTNSPVTYTSLATFPANGALSFTVAATGTAGTVTPGTGTLMIYQVN